MPPAGGTPHSALSGSGLERAPHTRVSGGTAAEQRERLLSATTETVAAHGYASTTIAEIAERAEVSRKTFYAHFADKGECFLAAYDAIAADYTMAIASAKRSGAEPSERTAAGLRALFERAAADPGALRMLTVEVAGAGAAGLARREKLIKGFEGLLRESLALPVRRGTISNPILKAVAGGLARILGTHVQSERPDLPKLVDGVVSWAGSYAAPAAMTSFRNPKPNRAGTFHGVWGGRAPGTLWLGSPPQRTRGRGPAAREQDVSRSFLVHSQREQILDAVTNLAAERGYDALTVEGVARTAGVSVAAFREQFSGSEDAFLVAYELGHSKGMAIVERAFLTEVDWRAGVRAGISALFDFLASEPSFAHMALVDALIATRRSAGRSRPGVSAYARMLLPGLERAPMGSMPPDVMIEAITGGVFELCLSYALKGRIAELSELAPHATYFALAPLIGAEEAARIATSPTW